MAKVLTAYQIPQCDDGTTITWHVENIAVEYNRKTKQWEYFLMTYLDQEDEWDSTKISKCQAREYCEVELPTMFYS